VTLNGKDKTHEVSITSRRGDVCRMRQPAAPSKTDNDRFRDLYECEREAAFAEAGAKSQIFDNCMRARGYRQ
jgi:hypothetical protein